VRACGPGANTVPRLLRIGHKGADAIRPGNTLESFAAAVEAGVDAIELDVLRPRADFADGSDWRAAPAGPVADSGGPLLVAHDWADSERRQALTLAEALDAFSRPPLHRVRFDLDLKIAGREDELVAMLRERSLLERAMVSTMEVRSIEALAELEPGLDRGWTLPRVDRDWNAHRWARPLVIAGSASLRARLPGLIRRRAPALGVWAVWVYHPLITGGLVGAAHGVGVEVIAWTVDDAERIGRLAALGVDGICTNDPRLLAG
jgi:glycerophosphoryl diester phosphodiesterase